MELILIRHGETRWNEEGRVQGLSDIENIHIVINESIGQSLEAKKEEKVSILKRHQVKGARKWVGQILL